MPTATQTVAPTSTTISTDTTKPTVTITFPTNGGFVLRNATKSVKASASDNVAVTHVDIYVGSSKLCSSTSSPYSCTWFVPAKPGVRYTITAIAFDKSNNSSSTSISVTAQ